MNYLSHIIKPSLFRMACKAFKIFIFFFNFISPCAVLNHSVVSNSLRPHGLHCPARLYCPWNSPGNTGLGFHALLQGIFPTQGLNPGLLHCRWILYCLSHQGSPNRLGLSWIQISYHFPNHRSSFLFCASTQIFFCIEKYFSFLLGNFQLTFKEKTYSLMNSFTYWVSLCSGIELLYLN